MNLIDQINTHKYLYLDKLIELNDLELELWISEAGVKEDKTNISENVSSYGAIETSELHKRYKIVFDNYIAYSVRNESFTVWDDYEKFTGNLFCVYSKSRFLDYISVAVHMFIVENTQENKIIHFGIFCLN